MNHQATTRYGGGRPVAPELGGWDRCVSLTVGGVLLATLPRLRLRDLALAALAGYATYRGVTGHCPVGAALLSRADNHNRQGAAELENLLRPVDDGSNADALKRPSATDRVVDEASRESFPASDAPTFSGTTAAPTHA